MAIVQCPECSKKLKVADTSVGKKVKCSCGHIFVAEPAEMPVAAPVGMPDKILVACTECGAKLKVATTSLGKKMKCPKCTGVFVAAVLQAAPVPALKMPPVRLDDDDQPKKNDDDDMDELLNFAHAESKADAPGDMDDDDELPKGLGRQFEDEEDEEEDLPRPKRKARKVEPDEDEEELSEPDRAAKPVYPSRLWLNIFVLLMVMGYLGFFAAVYFVPIDLGLGKPKTPSLRQPATKKGDAKPVPFRKESDEPPIRDIKNALETADGKKDDAPKDDRKKDDGKKEPKKDDAPKDDRKKDDGKKEPKKDDAPKDDRKKDDGKKDDPKKDDEKKDASMRDLHLRETQFFASGSRADEPRMVKHPSPSASEAASDFPRWRSGSDINRAS